MGELFQRQILLSQAFAIPVVSTSLPSLTIFSQTIEGLLSGYGDLFTQSTEWGKVDSEQKGDFNSEMDHFVHILSEALKSLSGGLELRRPDPEKVKGYEQLDTRNFQQKISQVRNTKHTHVPNRVVPRSPPFLFVHTSVRPPLCSPPLPRCPK